VWSSLWSLGRLLDIACLTDSRLCNFAQTINPGLNPTNFQPKNEHDQIITILCDHKAGTEYIQKICCQQLGYNICRLKLCFNLHDLPLSQERSEPMDLHCIELWQICQLQAGHVIFVYGNLDIRNNVLIKADCLGKILKQCLQGNHLAHCVPVHCIPFQ
jgi:hypothetical protein